MRFLKNVEKIIADHTDDRLRYLEHYYGIDLELFRQVKNNQSTFYGTYADNRTEFVSDFVGVLISDDFFPSDDTYAGNFEEGFLYTTFKNILEGDTVSIKSSDGKVRRFKVNARETKGTQTTVFTRYRLSNLAN